MIGTPPPLSFTAHFEVLPAKESCNNLLVFMHQHYHGLAIATIDNPPPPSALGRANLSSSIPPIPFNMSWLIQCISNF